MSILNDFDAQQAEIDKRFSLVSDKLEIATPYGGTEAGEANRDGASILLNEIEILIKRTTKLDSWRVKLGTGRNQTSNVR